MNSLRKLIACVCLSIATCTHAQLSDWIVDQIKSEIESEISEITNYNKEYMGTFGNYIWEAIVNSKCESDLADKAKEFENFKIDRSYMDRLPGKYPGRSKYWTNYSQIPDVLYKRSNSYFHQGSHQTIAQVANSKIEDYAAKYIDSISNRNRIESLEGVINAALLDSIKTVTGINGLADSLLNDIKANPKLAVMLNNHPETFRIYVNSVQATSLRQNTRHLLYWALQADPHHAKLPKKQRFINPRSLRFAQKGSSVDIIDGENIVASINGREIHVRDINILNLYGRPNTTYIFNNNSWETDRYGRVTTATQKISKDLKKKCKQKGLVKTKELGTMLGDAQAIEIGYYNSLDFGAPDVMLNTYFYDKTKDNKKAFKSAKKARNSWLKGDGSKLVHTCMNYGNYEAIPTNICFDDLAEINSYRQALNTDPTSPEIVTFNYNQYKDRVKPSHKIGFVNRRSFRNNSTTSASTAVNTTQKKSSAANTAGSSKGITTMVNTTTTPSGNHKSHVYTFKGKIDGKYAVTMNLYFVDDSIDGTYYYDKYKRSMKIKGHIKGNSKITLTEYEGNKATGEYVGTLNGNVFSGNFVNFASGKRMPFSLTAQ